MGIAKCAACGHEDEIPGSMFADVLRCDECGARIAFGIVMPRIVVEPSGPNFVALRINDLEQPLDHVLAHELGMALLSIARPPPPKPTAEAPAGDDAVATLG